jgi:hypothetical protein
MKRAILAAAVLAGVAQAAAAETVSGPQALALATIVAENAYAVSAPDKALLKAYLNGQADAPHRRGAVITVSADTVQCRVSNVDITSVSCDIGFGWLKSELNGRPAHELSASLADAGIPPDGAAGSVYRSISHLSCTIETDAVADRGGGGATCRFSIN